jgi:hypothetical protein
MTDGARKCINHPTNTRHGMAIPKKEHKLPMAFIIIPLTLPARVTLIISMGLYNL